MDTATSDIARSTPAPAFVEGDEVIVALDDWMEGPHRVAGTVTAIQANGRVVVRLSERLTVSVEAGRVALGRPSAPEAHDD